jgi:quinol monooxygenase YgiN
MNPAVIELRQYTLKPERRDALIALFEREFVESQEAAGMVLIGQFRDLDDPDRFVWLRGFSGMETRKAALEAFYSGPVWRAHREAANGTMIDSDDVLLLRPLHGAPAFRPGQRLPVGASGPGPGAVVVGVHRINGSDAGLPTRFMTDLAPRLTAAGLAPAAVLVTETAANTFPGLPVREGETVLVWASVLPDQKTADTAVSSARSDPALTALFAAALQVMRLQPTARSRLHGRRDDCR